MKVPRYGLVQGLQVWYERLSVQGAPAPPEPQVALSGGKVRGQVIGEPQGQEFPQVQ